MISLISIALGAACGALSRHGINILSANILKIAFPFGTLTVNILGSFLMGVCIALFAVWWNPPQSIRLFIVVGFLGSFTTFSTFSLDVMTLFSRGELLYLLLYMVTSFTLSISAIFLGNWLILRILTHG